LGSHRFFSATALFYNGGMNGTWSRVTIGNRPADVFDPIVTPRFTVLFLHDLDRRTLRDQPTFTQLFATAGSACVCPFGDQAWWTDRISSQFDSRLTAERYLLDCVMPFCAERWNLGPRAVGLFGVGMGGQGALRLAFKHPQHFPVVAALAPSIEYYELYGAGTPLEEMYDSKEQCRQDSAILHLHPSQYPPHIYFAVDPADPWHRGNDRLHEKMNALGVPHKAEFTSCGKQGWDYFDKMAEPALRFVVSGLETESRRLL
jgi:pimeloyl-ACP methyl ester carboxylesterase